MKKKLLWVGDAVVNTGFAIATHRTLESFIRAGWEVMVIGINHFGDPHNYPYPIFPAGGRTDDLFGVRRTKKLTEKYKPDLIIVQQDSWNFPQYIKAAGGTPIIGAVAVDGKNCQGHYLNGLSHAIFWTKFGEYEAKRGGYIGTSSVIPLGVDTDLFVPKMSAEARYRVGLPEEIRDAYIVGNVNRNQPRKRLDLVITHFCEWVKEFDIRDALLYLHVAPTGEDAYDLQQLMKYYGVPRRLILAEPEVGYGSPEHMMPYIYSSMDVMFSCTQGEGFGLTHFEGMACGVPQIVPDWSGLGELMRNEDGVECAELVTCSNIALTTMNINTIGGIIDRDEAITSLNTLYRDPRVRAHYRRLGLDLVASEKFSWKNVGEQWIKTCDEVLSGSNFISQVAKRADGGNSDQLSVVENRG